MSRSSILTSTTGEHRLLLVVVLLLLGVAEDNWWSSRFSAVAAAWSSERRTFLQTSAAVVAVPASMAVLLGTPSATATSNAGTVLDPLPGQQVAAGLKVPTEEYNARHLATLDTVRHPFRYSDSWTGTVLPLLTLDEALNAASVATHTPTSAQQRQGVPPATASEHYWPMGRWPDPILRRPADPVNLKDWSDRTFELQRAGDILRQTAQFHGAVGLAAQQCGINARIVYVELSNFNKYNNNNPNSYLIMINPRIVARSPETEMRTWREECLVLPPSFRATVLRDDWVDVAYYDCRQGQQQQLRRLRGNTARALQHELDHDRGILVTDHVGLEELETDLMRALEGPGHAERMVRAYERYIVRSAAD